MDKVKKKGKLGNRDRSDMDEKNANPGSRREEGYLFYHVLINGSKHMARYVKLNGHLFCNICQKEV